jgi:hypothetical protein
MRGRVTVPGAASVAAYLIALAAIEATGIPDWESIASSPAAIAHGRVWLLLSSGLVIEGLPWAQLSVVTVVLVVALRQLGAVRLWIVALTAHLGAALIAYTAVAVLWLVHRSWVDADEPDYGISVVLAGELGALAARGGRRMGLLVGAAALIGFGIGVADSSVLANAEHLLGFGLGALTIAVLDKYMPDRQYSPA